MNGINKAMAERGKKKSYQLFQSAGQWPKDSKSATSQVLSVVLVCSRACQPWFTELGIRGREIIHLSCKFTGMTFVLLAVRRVVQPPGWL